MYSFDLMRGRLLASALVLLLSGADSGATALCAAYCTSSASAGGARIHHHQMVSNSQISPISVSQHTHSRHHGAPCAECPPASLSDLSQKADCASLVQIQALKESSFSLDAPHKAAQIAVADAAGSDFPLTGDRERCLVFDTSQTDRTSHPASVSLRI